VAHDFTDDVTIEDAHVAKGECNMGKSVTRKSLLPAGSRWLMQGVEKSRKEEKRLNGTRGLRSFIHEGRGFTRTRSSTEVRQEKPHAEAACGHSLAGEPEDTQA